MTGWADSDNGTLLAAAEEAFAVFVTLDTNLVHQRNVRSYELGIVVVDVHPIVPSHLREHMQKVSSALSIAVEEQGFVVVRNDGLRVLSP